MRRVLASFGESLDATSPIFLTLIHWSKSNPEDQARWKARTGQARRRVGDSSPSSLNCNIYHKESYHPIAVVILSCRHGGNVLQCQFWVLFLSIEILTSILTKIVISKA